MTADADVAQCMAAVTHRSTSNSMPLPGNGLRLTPLPELRRRRIEAALVNDNVRITPIR